jgi:AraC-like DNA-binding protein
VNEVHKTIAEYVRNHPDERLTDIAERIGISEHYLHRILRAHGVSRKPRLEDRDILNLLKKPENDGGAE